MDRRTLALALASVAEVETALAGQDKARVESKTAARTALNAGERGEWLLADVQVEVAGWNRERLGTMLRTRAEAVAPAMAKFLESRREHEQVKQLMEDARQAARVEEDRRAQAAADDWFLSRRRQEAE
jgi:urease gamma subunit